VLEEEMRIVAGTTESTIMMPEPQVEIVSLPPATESLIQDRLLHLATAWHFGARRTHFGLTRMHLTRRLNLQRSWTMVGSSGVTRDVHCQVVHAGNATGVSKSVHAVTIKVNAVTRL
jgi:hypothetical protein